MSSYPSSYSTKRKAYSPESKDGFKRQRGDGYHDRGSSSIQSTVASHYNNRRDPGLKNRRLSKIIRLKNFNNWIKSVLLDTHIKPGNGVLDICGGKGGDLMKFQRNKIGFLVLADHAEMSVRDAVTRYNEMGDRRSGRLPFPAKFIAADCHVARLSNVLDPDVFFDVVSCQFAFHYCFESEERARGLLLNISERLRPGGFFVGTTPDARVLCESLDESRTLALGNSVFSVKFDRPQMGENGTFFNPDKPFGIRYTFSLEDSIDDCPEYLVHFPSLQKLALEYGLELVLCENFHDFFYKHADPQAFPFYHDLLAKVKVVTDRDTLSEDEWAVARVYLAFAFRKMPSNTPVPPKGIPSCFRGEPRQVRRDQITVINT